MRSAGERSLFVEMVVFALVAFPRSALKRGADQIIVAVRPLTLFPALWWLQPLKENRLDLSGNLGSRCNIGKLLQYPHRLDGNNRLAQVLQVVFILNGS